MLGVCTKWLALMEYGIWSAMFVCLFADEYSFPNLCEDSFPEFRWVTSPPN